MLVDKTLANILGLKEAIILSQINYWIEINKKNKRNFHEGRYWTYNSIKSWGEEFSLLSTATIKRAIKKLRDMNIIVTGNFNTYQMDRTLWYSINYSELEKIIRKYNSKNDNNDNDDTNTKLDKLDESRLNKIISSNESNDKLLNDQMEKDNLTQALPETSTKTSSEIIFKSISKSKSRKIDRNTKLVNEFNSIYNKIIKNCELNLIDKSYKGAVAHALKILILDILNNKKIKIGNNFIPAQIIKEDIFKLDFFIIGHAINKFKEASRRINIKNTIAYLKTCIYNYINEIKIEVDANLRFNGVI